MISTTARKVMFKILTRLFVSPPQQVEARNNPISHGDSQTTSDFVLDDTCEFSVDGPRGVHPRWMHVSRCIDDRYALILNANERFQSKNLMPIHCDTRLFIRFTAALSEVSKDGLVLEITFQSKDNQLASLATFAIAGGAQPPVWREIETDLSFVDGMEGYVVLSVRPGSAGGSIADWVAVSDLCLARLDRLSLVKASSFHRQRASNEIEHFKSVYQHSMYSSSKPKVRHTISPRELERSCVSQDSTLGPAIKSDVPPRSGESTYMYASRLLASCLGQRAPSFPERLKGLVTSQQKIKVLSLCSGAARIEGQLAAQVGNNVHWSLLDMNEELLQMASEHFPADARIDLIKGDVNSISYSGETWDVIMVVSALHHIVELEKVVQFCHKSLSLSGELWILGESVGRNGNRLWPEAQDVANKVFSALPEKYRFNRHTQQIDLEILDKDYSVGTFEGIRSEEIESVLARWFRPDEILRRNCFLWRLTNLAYADNFDITNEYDRKLLINMVNAEVEHFESGGRGTELFAAYRPLQFVSRAR